MTTEEINAHNHDAFHTLQSFNRLNPLTEVPRHNGTRTIDHLYANFELNNRTIIDIPDLRLLSDHNPIYALAKSNGPAAATSIPNKHFDYLTATKLLELANNREDINLPQLFDEASHYTRRSGHKTTKRLKINARAIAGPVKVLTELISQPNFIDKLDARFKEFTDKIIKDRFSPAARAAFQALKKLTAYNTFEKRDGSIMTEAIH